MRKKRKTVMFFSDYASEYSGNFVSSLLALENRLAETGVDCIYAFPVECENRTWTKQLVAFGKHVVYFDFRQSRFKKFFALNNLLKSYNVDVLHAHFSFVLGLELLSFIRPRVKFVIHIHSDFSRGKETVRERIRNSVLYGLLAFRSTLVFISPKYVKYNKKRAMLVLNALATKRLPCDHKSGAQLREEIGCSPDTTLIEVLGWSPYVKGVDIAVEATRRLVDEGCDVKLLLVCGRSVRPSNMAEFVKNNTSCSAEEAFISYVHPIEDVFCYHEAADICLSSSRSETFSYALLEMLSLGKRCVLSDIPGVQWATKYTSAIRFATEDIESCVCALKQAMTDLPKRSEEVAEQVRCDYDIQQWADQIIELYDL